MAIFFRRRPSPARTPLRVLLARRRKARVRRVVLAVAGATIVGLFAWLAYDLTFGLPGRDALRSLGDMAEATILYDAADRPVFTIFKERRIEVPLSRLSPHLARAIVAVEDQRFFDHRGVDLVRVAAAAFTNLRQGRVAQGGSTITQQLARQSFLSSDKTLRRKLKEAVLAARIERLYTKSEILELYLNKVYFGDGLYGAEAAARGYFGKPAAELDLAEAALLAGLVKSPSNYAPTVNLERAVTRRNLVLQAMHETGAIGAEAWARARATPVSLRDTLRGQDPYGRYFKEQVRRELVERFGVSRVYEGGLRVYTTIDAPMQQVAETLMEHALRDIEARRNVGPKTRRARPAPGADAAPSDRLQGALIAIDPHTGHVRALVGGRDFDQSRFNRALQARRQPGSAFKPFVFAAALESGFTPATLLDRLDEPVPTSQGLWRPDDGHRGGEAMTLRSALRVSSNRAAVHLLRRVGIDRTVEYARKFGVGTLPSVPSLALGSGEVTLASLTAAYGAFASRGVARPPVLIRRVEDRLGTILFVTPESATQAVREDTAFLVATMLADALNWGTGYRARQAGFTLPAGGKTGTTNDFVDAWFVGFTPKLVAGVWIGFDQPQTILPNGFAGDLAVPLWARFMTEATRGHRPVWFEPPRGVDAIDVCRLSGKRPSPGCGAVKVTTKADDVETRSLVYTEYFAAGTEPDEFCDLHAGPSLLERIASLFGQGSEPAPVAADDPAVVPPSPSEPATATSRENIEGISGEQPPQKRGFWARLFGFGKKDKGKPRQ